MPLDIILEDLKSEASFDSHGLFTLDKTKARAKMKQYQLLDAHYYVLELVQAAVAGGATRIDFYIDADDFIMTFDGQHFTKDELDNIYSSLFVSQKDTKLERFRKLAIGLNSAQALNPKFIKVISGNGHQAAQLIFTPPDNESIVEPEEIINGTKIHVKDRISWRTAGKFLLKKFIDRLPTEGRIIQKRCIYCPVPVTVNEQQIITYSDFSENDVLCSLKFEKDGIKGIIGIPKSSFEKSYLQFVKHGVLINTRHLKLTNIPVVGVVRDDHFTVNASQSDIVENPVYKDALKIVKTQIDNLVCELAETHKNINPVSDHPDDLKALEYIHNAAGIRFRIKGFKRRPTRLMRALIEPEIFETTEKKFVNLKTLVEQLVKTGFVPFSTKHFDDRHPKELHVLLLDNNEKIQFFNRMFNAQVRNVEQDFEEAIIRRQKIDSWNAAKTNRTVLFSDTIIRNTIETENITGEIGLSARESDGFCHISFSVENGLICHKSVEAGGLTIDASINNDRLNPVYTWDDITADDEFYKTLETIIINSQSLFLNLAEKIDKMPLPDYVRFDKETLRYKKEFDLHRMHVINYMNFILEEPENKKNDRLKNIRAHFTEFHDILKTLRIFPTVEGKVVSLNDLQEQMTHSPIIPYVPREMVGPGIDRLHIIMAIGRKEYEVLQKYFGADKVKNYEKELADERALIQHLNRPVEKPEFFESTIEKIKFSRDEADGEIGLLTRIVDTGRFNFQKNRTLIEPGLITILKKNRTITTRLLDFPISGVKISVNFDKAGVNSTWTEVHEDKAWEELKSIIISVLSDLALEIGGKLETYRHIDIIRAKNFLQQFAAFYLGNLGYLHKTDPTASKIMEFPIFNNIDGSPITLSILNESRKKFGGIAYVDSSLAKTEWSDRPVCSASVHELEILRKIFGFRNLENFESRLKNKLADEVIKKTKLHEEPVINDNSVLIKKVYRDIGGISGEVGLLRSSYVLSSLRILKENRFVMTKVMNTCMKVEASLNYDQLAANQAWTAVIEDERYKHLINFLHNCQHDLVRMLLESYDSFSEDDKTEAAGHIIDYLTAVRKKYLDLKSEKASTPIGKLARLKIFRDLTGKKLSFIDIINRYEKEKRLNYTIVPGSSEPMDKKNIVLVLTQRNLQQLSLLFPRMHDYAPELALEKIALKHMSKPPLEDLKIRENCLVSIPVKTKSLNGELALPDKLPLKQGIVFAKNMISVVSKVLYPRSNVFGVINNDSFNTNPVFTDVTLREREKNVLFSRILKLYETLADNWHKVQNTDTRETARRLLLDFYFEQKYYTSSQFHIIDENLEKKISSLPLLPVHDGRLVSIDTILLDETERQGFVSYITPREQYRVAPGDIVLKIEPYGFDYEFCRRILGDDRLRHYTMVRKIPEEKIEEKTEEKTEEKAEEKTYENQVLAEKTETPEPERIKPFIEDTSTEHPEIFEAAILPQKTMAGADSLQSMESTVSGYHDKNHEKYNIHTQEEIHFEGITKKHVEPVGKDGVESLSLRVDLSPDQQLLSMIRKEFRIIRTRDNYKLSEKILANTRVTSRGNAPAVTFGNGILSINSADPFVKEITESLNDSPHKIYYLLSVIYSTINREVQEITDEDEMKFQVTMLENLLQYPSLSSERQFK
jgi:hypothetical protein